MYMNPLIKQQQKANQQVNRRPGPRAHPAHLAALAAEKKKARVRVRVEPTREALRHVLQHPNGMAFRAQGSVEWPLDRFTQRRLDDGSIRVVAQIDSQTGQVKKAEEPKHHSSRRSGSDV
jgi:hypothetical protein